MDNLPDQIQNQVKTRLDKEHVEKLAKITYFYADAKQDTVTPKQFLDNLDNLLSQGAVTNDNIISRILPNLKGNAKRWYEGLDFTGDKPTDWQDFRQKFIAEYNIQLTQFEATTKITALSQKRSQTVKDFRNDCTEAIRDLFNNIQFNTIENYGLPIPDGDLTAAQRIVATDNRRRSQEECTRIQKDSIDIIKNQIVKNFFSNGLLPQYKSKVLSRPHLTWKETIAYATELEKIALTTASAPIAATEEEQEEEYVEAVRPNGYNNQNRGGNSNRGNYQRNDQNRSNNSNNSGAQNWRQSNRSAQPYRGQQRGGYQGATQNQRYGSNAQKPIVCWHCNKPGHVQTVCKTRIAMMKPLLTKRMRVFSIAGVNVVPEHGISDEVRQLCIEAGIQGFCENEDFQ